MIGSSSASRTLPTSLPELGLELVVVFVGHARDGVEHVDELLEIERLERAQRAQIDAPGRLIDGERAVLGGEVVQLEQLAVQLFALGFGDVHDRREKQDEALLLDDIDADGGRAARHLREAVLVEWIDGDADELRKA